jgi:hypothetical protein
MRGTLVLSLVALALATQARIFLPIYHGLRLAAGLVESNSEAAELSEQNRELEEVRDYLRTPPGQELSARAEVHAARPGERIVLLQEAPSAAARTLRPVTLAERVQGALQQVGEKATAGLRTASRVLATWAGWRPRERSAARAPREEAKSVPGPVTQRGQTGTEQ